MLSATMLCHSLFPIKLNVVMLSVIMLNVVMLSVIMLNVFMLSVVAPSKIVCLSNAVKVTDNREDTTHGQQTGQTWAKFSI